jgi:2,5-diketo-D-gluconate reductase B
VLELLGEARARGLASHVGVSNYTVAMLREAKAVLGEVAVNQVEFHPLLNQDALQRGADALGVTLSGYATLAKGAVTQEPLLAEIGAAYGKSAGQVALRWILQKGVAATTMSTKPANIRANFEVMDFTLSSVDMARIDRLRARGLRTVDTPRVRWAPQWD